MVGNETLGRLLLHLVSVVCQALGETSWLSTAKKRTEGRGGKGGGCSRWKGDLGARRVEGVVVVGFA